MAPTRVTVAVLLSPPPLVAHASRVLEASQTARPTGRHTDMNVLCVAGLLTTPHVVTAVLRGQDVARFRLSSTQMGLLHPIQTYIRLKAGFSCPPPLFPRSHHERHRNRNCNCNSDLSPRYPSLQRRHVASGTAPAAFSQATSAGGAHGHLCPCRCCML